jgi:MFS family permease
MVVMVGAWGSLAWAPAWIAELTPVAERASAGANVSYAFMLFNVGAVFGFLAIMWLPDLVGRRGTYLIFCAGSLVTTLTLFTQVHTIGMLFLLMPMCGVFVSGALGAVATYLPELFPTVVRAAGQGVSYNAARFLTAGGVLASGALVGALGSYPAASAVVATVYAVGFLVAWLAPETKGHALEDV